jgi:hypothetical protein
MLSVIILNVVMLNVVKLNAVAPFSSHPTEPVLNSLAHCLASMFQSFLFSLSGTNGRIRSLDLKFMSR